jgi:hypothetical protein
MAGAREEGLIRFVAVRDEGGSEPIMGYVDTRELAPSGKLAEPEQWYNMRLSSKVFNGSNGWKIQMLMNSEANDTLDNADDSIFKIKAFINGVLTTIGKQQFQQRTGEAFASPSVTAGTDSIIGEYKIPAGTSFQLGGGKVWIEPKDDTE